MEEWINNNNEFLQSSLLLENGFSHAFFTKKINLASPNNLINIFSSKHEVYMLKQIHSNIVEFSSNLNGGKSKEADALISDNSKQQSLWIYSADCIPILFADIKTGRVGACHAGWKGIAGNIITNIIKAFKDNGSRESDLIVALGPAISYQNYEVDNLTASKILNSCKKKNTGNQYSKEIFEKLNFVKTDTIKNKIFIDIRMAAITQLKNEGLNKAQLSINKHCTFNEESLFHSWRRDKIKASQWSVILSK